MLSTFILKEKKIVNDLSNLSSPSFSSYNKSMCVYTYMYVYYV